MEPSRPVTPEIAVVIPNYRRPDLCMRCLASVLPAAERVERGAEIVVVDDGSGDGGAETIAAAFPDVRLVPLPANRGYPGAVNAGIAACEAPWILTLNNDTTVDPDVLVRLLEAVGTAPDVGSAAALQLFAADPSTIYSAGLVLDRLGVNADRLMGMPRSAGERAPIEVFGACGGAAAYRRAMLTEIGGFDERFRFGLEDADVAWRARMRGWSCVYVPDAIVYHDLGATVPHGSPYRFRQAGRNRVRLVAKNADPALLRRYGMAMIAYDLAYVGYALARYRMLAPVLGRWEALRRFRTIRSDGADGRGAVELSPPQGPRAALRRHASWPRVPPL